MVEFLHDLTAALEQHYFAQLRRHYSPDRTLEPELDLAIARVTDSNDRPF